MKNSLRERRTYLVQTFGKTFSLKDAVQLTAQKFSVDEHVVYVDWSRRTRWLEDLVNFRESGTIVRQLLISLEQILRDVEMLRLTADNDNCRLGALHLSASVRFKMLDVFLGFPLEQAREDYTPGMSWTHDPFFEQKLKEAYARHAAEKKAQMESQG